METCFNAVIMLYSPSGNGPLVLLSAFGPVWPFESLCFLLPTVKPTPRPTARPSTTRKTTADMRMILHQPPLPLLWLLRCRLSSATFSPSIGPVLSKKASSTMIGYSPRSYAGGGVRLVLALPPLSLLCRVEVPKSCGKDSDNDPVRRMLLGGMGGA